MRTPVNRKTVTNKHGKKRHALSYFKWCMSHSVDKDCITPPKSREDVHWNRNMRRMARKESGTRLALGMIRAFGVAHFMAGCHIGAADE